MDGKTQGVKYNSSDNICLDGQRLVPINSSVKWANNSEYRTKIETYSKIIYAKNRFYVYTKAGDIKEYHKYNEAWFLRTIKDRYKNSITYNYNSTSSETYLSSIQYADNTILFNYDNKLDSFSGYSNGRNIKLTKRLKSIDIKNGSNILRTYTLAYYPQSSSLDKSTLKSITECSGGECLEPLYVKYKEQGKLEFKNYTKWMSAGQGQHKNNYVTGSNSSGTYSALVDMNGDGLPDRVGHYNYNTKQYGIWVALNTGSEFGKLTQITDSFKNTTTINYNRLNDKSNAIYTKYINSSYPDRDIISAMQVVESIESEGSNDTRLKTSYKYEGLKTNLIGLGSYGFAKITTRNHLNESKTIEYFLQSSPFSGIAYKTESYLKDELLSKNIINEVGFKTRDADATFIINEKTGEYEYANIEGSIEFPFLKTDRAFNILVKKQTTKTHDNGSLLKTESILNENYDSYGNIGTITSTITDNTTGDEFTKVTNNTYTNDTSKWILARLTNAIVESRAYGDTKTKESSFTYDPNTGILLSETIEPNSGKALTKTYKYDNKGNKISESISGDGITSRTTTTSYDPLGKFATSITNPLGHNETRTYNPDGQLLTLTGPNGLTTTWQYDNFGKKIKENRADGTSTMYDYIWNPGFGALYSIVITKSGSKPITTYYNKLGQAVLNIKVGFDGRYIFQSNSYNNFGLLSQKSTPYFYGSSEGYDLSYIYYDKYQRPVKQDNLAPNEQRAVETIRYDGFTTITTDAKGHEKKTIKNALDKITYIEEEEGAYQRYEYDANGALIKTIDAQGNEIKLEYDDLGNKKSQDDPDMGKWFYIYNSLGQLTSQTDAKNQTTTFTYDILGRKVKETNGDGESTWEYDTTYKGKLHKESKPNYSKVYTYDEYGRVIKTITTIDEVSYTQSYKYDTYGKIIEKTLPNEFKLNYIYKNDYLLGIYSPTKKILDFDPKHFTDLVQKVLNNSINHLEKQKEYEQKAYSLAMKAHYYHNTPVTTKMEKLQISEYAKELDRYVKIYQSYADKEKERANYYKNQAEYYLNKIKEYETEVWASNYKEFALPIIQSYQEYAQKHLELSKEYLADAQAKVRQSHYTKSMTRYYNSTLQSARDTINEYKKAISIAKNYEQKAKDNQKMNQEYMNLYYSAEHGKRMYYYKVLEQDSFGRVTKYLNGNGLITNQEYSAAGYLEKITTGYSFEDEDIRHLTYEYDELSNVTNRSDHKLEVYQNYTYDRLDRLTNTYTDSKLRSTTTSYHYDNIGNILYKSDVGEYEYSNENPHQVIRAGSKKYTYDANGNMTYNSHGYGTKIEYNSYNKATKLSIRGDEINFAYDTAKFRYKKETNNYTTHYLDKSYEATTHTDGTSDLKCFIYADGKVVSIYTDSTNPNQSP